MASRKAPLPERPRSYQIALTPLADAMFQLLIFFMLTSSLAPYSLITLKTAPQAVSEEDAAAGVGPGNDPSQPAAPTAAADLTLWTVGNGSVRTSGLDYSMDQLSALAEAIGPDAPGRVVLIITSEARVQDVATALEALEDANVGAVQISREGA